PEEPWSRAARGPVEIRVLLRVRTHDGAVGERDVDPDDVLAGQAKMTASPTETALEQKAAHGDVGSVRRRKEQAPARQRSVERCALDPRPDARDACRLVDLDRIHAREIDQQRVVAEMILRPAMAAGAQADLEPGGFGVPDR